MTHKMIKIGLGSIQKRGKRFAARDYQSGGFFKGRFKTRNNAKKAYWWAKNM